MTMSTTVTTNNVTKFLIAQSGKRNIYNLINKPRSLNICHYSCSKRIRDLKYNKYIHIGKVYV